MEQAAREATDLDVYLVRDGALQTVGVFSTQENAQTYIDAEPDVQGALGPYRPSLDIEPMTVDALLPRRGEE